MTKPITNTDDVIDSRDVIERMESIVNELSILFHNRDDERAHKIANEFNKLKAFAEQGEKNSKWGSGVEFIRASYFTEYCEEMYKDRVRWSEIDLYDLVIDWWETAKKIKVDYTAYEFDGVTYYAKN